MDTPAFQHLLSLFPQLTLRQHCVAQQELTAPHTITSLNSQLPACNGCPHCQPLGGRSQDTSARVLSPSWRLKWPGYATLSHKLTWSATS